MIVVTLTVTQGNDQGASFRILEGETKVIGRSAKADILLTDEGISRKHCRTRVEQGTPYLFDLDSKNGTFLNGKTITIERVMRHDDLIDLGTSRLSVRVDSDSETPVEASPIEPGVEAISLERGDAEGEASLMGAYDRYLDQKHATADRSPSQPDALATTLEAPPAVKPPPPPADLSGTLVGGCRVEELISFTPTRQTYRATQLSMARIVALRVLAPRSTTDKAAVARFAQAARDGGRLVHPNIVQVYDAGVDNDIHFIALELVEGQSLREIILRRSRPSFLDIEEALSIAEQIVEALEFAHAQSTVHGSITADNIFVTTHGVAKLADFGLTEDAIAPMESSREPARLLALCCRAPEQIADASAASIRSDIYSLGAILFFMVTGRPPFKGMTRKDVTERILRGKPEQVRAYRKGVPESLAKIVARSMARATEDRHAHASEMKEDIARARAELNP